jgi:signal transduction histidine kinase/HAMP domain-containing protein
MAEEKNRLMLHNLIPSSIRSQLVAGSIALQLLLLTVFLALVLQRETADLRMRNEQRIISQVRLLAQSSRHNMQPDEDGTYSDLQDIVDTTLTSTAIRDALVTNLDGKIIADSNHLLNGTYLRDPGELQAARQPFVTKTINMGDDYIEGVTPIVLDGNVVGFAWIRPDPTVISRQIAPFIQTSVGYALLALLTNTLLAIMLARTVTQPLSRLLRGMQLLVSDPAHADTFPLPVTTLNEVGELTSGFNIMVSELREQRTGLNDTLALLDSMLANAPVGFAFYDQEFRYVRLNQYLADIHQRSISDHLGRKVSDIFPESFADRKEGYIRSVFEAGRPVTDVELSVELSGDSTIERTWLYSFYPVRTGTFEARWVGAVVVEVTQRRLAEDAMRKSEKLAAAGRLAASISHEINNPLEAVTNLLFLLQGLQSLDDEAREYANMAQNELARVSAITQQTLRFYRQATHPQRANLGELMDSVITLHHGRINSLHVHVERRYRGAVELLSLGGELRQLFANLIGNAIDAMGAGGRLRIDLRHSYHWATGAPGVRVVIADTGSGIANETRQRIFEPFFTTKEATGTGLGLWVSAEIVQKHGGILQLRSRTESPSGTVFMLFFPESGLKETAELATAN